MGIFKIDVDQMCWTGDSQDDPTDLCLHGHVTVQIGQNHLEAIGTVSATALYLLKTLSQDKYMSEFDIQMVPCCGHSLFADQTLTNVTISGCPYGLDWTTFHHGAMIHLLLPDTTETIVPFADYRDEVFCFADKVERFYLSCAPKILPQNEWDRNGYIAFWNEWHRRRKITC